MLHLYDVEPRLKALLADGKTFPMKLVEKSVTLYVYGTPHLLRVFGAIQAVLPKARMLITCMLFPLCESLVAASAVKVSLTFLQF